MNEESDPKVQNKSDENLMEFADQLHKKREEGQCAATPIEKVSTDRKLDRIYHVVNNIRWIAVGIGLLVGLGSIGECMMMSRAL